MSLIEQLLSQEISLNTLVKEMIIKIILDEVKNMIWYIHYKYPEKFKKKEVKEYIKKYQNIILVKYSQSRQSQIKKNIKKKLEKKKFKNIGLFKTKNKDNTKYHKNDKYCNARVWNCGLVKKLKTKTIYGGRCCRKKETNKNYCFQHTRNLKHGDYFQDPKLELIKHFTKE